MGSALWLDKDMRQAAPPPALLPGAAEKER